ncbi:Alpha/beta hydrolase family protein [Phaeobacter inhibens]|uniref:Alpha/beta hydrolase family protein n=1 Tax=Phaeobacter inhibens TaxID=221822 RepID=A0A2I7JT55_9RHOB|nr:alpha/beta fold hydrolase [Phaeobacter inhibens]AUQ49034.1 Alpha/beta hydrolase family protein [Phaeobacter inhibens]AUQ93534.1 Alpha/beta hydrolase family protein [Phaeobacter inhibens]AUQ99986.1 Alpha/beta hydrolase family protein [Phaeobacter inhibens]AUR18837.1 Alpha/beta hydrolase family protein [Phaeobacter inhibens]
MKGDWVKRGSPTAPVVVFIHGFLSSGEKCWLHASGAYWPNIVADDPELSDLGVYVFTYSTGFFSGGYRLADAVDALKEHLALDGITGSAGIVFVCHSMGGIIARRFLVSRATELIERKVQVALFLLASPSLGSDYANWLKPLARILGHSQGDALGFTRSNTWLADLDRDFLNLKEGGRLSLVGKELIEDRFIVLRRFWRKQVVEPFSGARYFGEPYKVPESDHFSIAKIENDRAVQHRQLKRFVVEWRQTKIGATTYSESAKQSRTTPKEPGEASCPICVSERTTGERQGANPDVLPSQEQLSVIDEAVARVPHASLEVIMGDPSTRHLVDRFWDLDASDRREIALELGLISDLEVALPEQQRYDLALVRASERDLLDRLEELIDERE